MNKRAKLTNDTFLDTNSIVNDRLSLSKYLNPMIIGDGVYDTLIAEVTFSHSYQRESLVISAILVGYTDPGEGGIALIGLACGETVTTGIYASILPLGNIQVYTTTNGNTIKVYIKKTTHYRNLYVSLINKTSNVKWLW